LLYTFLYFQISFAEASSKPSKNDQLSPSSTPPVQLPEAKLEDVDVSVVGGASIANPADTNQTIQDVLKTEELAQRTRQDKLAKIASNGNLDDHSINSNASADVQRNTAVQKGKLGGFLSMNK
jgi:hypothetical protein